MALSEKEKNDLYWQKRKHYISVLNSKGGFKERYLNPDTAEDVMECYASHKDDPRQFVPVGDEFDPFPPTAGGEKFFADSVARLLHTAESMNEKSIGEVLSDEQISDETKSILSQGLCGIGEMLRRLMDDYFVAAGFVDGKAVDDPEARKKGRAAFKVSLEEYEKDLGEVFSKFGKAVIESLARDKSTVSDSPQIGEDPVFEALLDEAEDSSFIMDELDDLRDRVKKVLVNEAKLSVVRDALQKQIIDSFVRKDSDPVMRQIMTRTFLEYRLGVDEQLSEMYDIRQACYYYAYTLIREEPVDVIVAEKIAKHLAAEVEVLDDKMRFATVSGFSDLRIKVDAIPEPVDFEAICALASDIRKYMAEHPGVLDGQCLMSIAPVYSDIGILAEKARALFVGLDRFTRTNEAYAMDRGAWLVLFENWVLADSVCRVAYTLMDLLERIGEHPVSEASDILREILPDISYTMAERESRIALQRIILERSGVYAISK